MATSRLCALSSVSATASATSLGELHRQRAAAHQLGQVLAVDVLHGDEEIAVQVAGIVDPRHARIHGRQVGLQLGAAAFGLDGIAGIGVGGVLDQLERHLGSSSVSRAR